ncbi:hypothetical protein RJ639_009911 [Escallonia herrerae]|uniref:DUF7477 domain-containing protein n=1 Tax=Escallonia herrerae TaxID=1293975 RepID=A0AA88VS97_9ASTE|nr:hypothetical protein RJ639_009911 [Escallonia herrerae]
MFDVITYNNLESKYGTPYTQQSYKVSESFPIKWINKKWKEEFHVTSMTTAGSYWGVVMSRNSGYSEQDDTIGDLKKLVAQIGTQADKIRIEKWYNTYKDHITLKDYEIHDGMGLKLYYN